MEAKQTRESCIALLVSKAEGLAAEGSARYPRRSDFGDDEVMAIKAYLGPWPRALESAGIKPPRDDDAKELREQWRILAKRSRTQAKKRIKNDKTLPCPDASGEDER